MLGSSTDTKKCFHFSSMSAVPHISILILRQLSMATARPRLCTTYPPNTTVLLVPGAIPGVPISGTVMGFTVGLRDDDDGGDWDAYLIWEGTNTSGAPEEFGSLVFTERLEDRIDALEARIIQLEQKLDELLEILSEFEGLPPP